MFKKKFFDGHFVISDLKKTVSKPEVPVPKPLRLPKVTIVRREDKPQIEKDLDNLLEGLLKSGQKEKAYLIQQIFEKPKDFSEDVIRKIQGKDKSNVMTPTDATAFLLREDLTKQQYQTIKKESDARKLHFLPSYKVVQQEKKKALPNKMKITESCAQVPLKELMIKTFERHMLEKSFKKMIYQLTTKNKGKKLKLHMFYKSGYDVASGQSRFKVSQKYYFIISRLVEHFGASITSLHSWQVRRSFSRMILPACIFQMS